MNNSSNFSARVLGTKGAKRRTSKDKAFQIKSEALGILADGNATAPAERQVTRRAALDVVWRSLNDSRGEMFKVRREKALADLNEFLAAAYGDLTLAATCKNSDLFSVSHPFSTSSHLFAMTASAIRECQTHWVLADKSISDDVRPLLASYLSADSDSAQFVYAKAGLTASGYLDALAPLLAAIGDGNSFWARSMRARRQRRDRKGRFAWMGGGMRALIRRADGSISYATGRSVGFDQNSNTFDMELEGGRIVRFDASKGEALKATLDAPAGSGGFSAPFNPDATDMGSVINESDLVEIEAPAGWNAFSADEQTLEGGRTFKAFQSEAGDFEVGRFTNTDGSREFVLNRVNPDGTTNKVATADSWADVVQAVRGATSDDEKRAVKARLDEEFGAPLEDEDLDELMNPTPAAPERPAYVPPSNEFIDRIQRLQDERRYPAEGEFDDASPAEKALLKRWEDAGSARERQEVIDLARPLDEESAVPVAPSPEEQRAAEARVQRDIAREDEEFPEFDVPEGFYPLELNNPNRTSGALSAPYIADRASSDDIIFALEDALRDPEGMSSIDLGDGGELADVTAEQLYRALEEQGIPAVTEADRIYGSELVREDFPTDVADDADIADIFDDAEAEEPVADEDADYEEEADESNIPPLLEGLTEDEFQQWIDSGHDHTPFLPANQNIQMPEGYFQLDPEPYGMDEIITVDEEDEELIADGYPVGWTDDPYWIANNFSNTNAMIRAFRKSLRPGAELPGFARMKFEDENGDEFNTFVDSRALRDALQLQGVDTNEILSKLAKEGVQPDITDAIAEDILDEEGVGADEEIEGDAPEEVLPARARAEEPAPAVEPEPAVEAEAPEAVVIPDATGKEGVTELSRVPVTGYDGKEYEVVTRHEVQDDGDGRFLPDKYEIAIVDKETGEVFTHSKLDEPGLASRDVNDFIRKLTDPRAQWIERKLRADYAKPSDRSMFDEFDAPVSAETPELDESIEMLSNETASYRNKKLVRLYGKWQVEGGGFGKWDSIEELAKHLDNIAKQSEPEGVPAGRVASRLRVGDYVKHEGLWKKVASVSGTGLNATLYFDDGSYAVSSGIQDSRKLPYDPSSMDVYDWRDGTFSYRGVSFKKVFGKWVAESASLGKHDSIDSIKSAIDEKLDTSETPMDRVVQDGLDGGEVPSVDELIEDTRTEEPAPAAEEVVEEPTPTVEEDTPVDEVVVEEEPPVGEGDTPDWREGLPETDLALRPITRLVMNARNLQPGDVTNNGFIITEVGTERDSSGKIEIKGYFPNGPEQTKKWRHFAQIDITRNIPREMLPPMGNEPEIHRPMPSDFEGGEQSSAFRTALARWRGKMAAALARWTDRPDVMRDEFNPETDPHIARVYGAQLRPGDVTADPAKGHFVITDVRPHPDKAGRMIVEGYYPGHQMQDTAKEWKADTVFEVYRNVEIPEQGDLPPFHQPHIIGPRGGWAPDRNDVEGNRIYNENLAAAAARFNAPADIQRVDFTPNYNGEDSADPNAAPVRKPSRPRDPADPMAQGEFVNILREANGDPARLKELLKDRELIFFDFETTGLDFQNDNVWQIGAVKVVNGEIVDRFNVYMNPDKPLDPAVVAKLNQVDPDGNPLTDEFLQAQPSRAEVMAQFAEWAGANPLLVGQNTKFDRTFLERIIQEDNLAMNPAGYFDNQAIARALHGAMEPDARPKNAAGTRDSNSLGDLARHYGIDITHHDAASDSEATHGVLFKMLDKMAETGLGVDALNVDQMLADAAEAARRYNDVDLPRYQRELAAWEAAQAVKRAMNGEQVNVDQLVDAVTNPTPELNATNAEDVAGSGVADAPINRVIDVAPNTSFPEGRMRLATREWAENPANTREVPRSDMRVGDVQVGDFMRSLSGDHMYQVVRVEEMPNGQLVFHRADLESGEVHATNPRWPNNFVDGARVPINRDSLAAVTPEGEPAGDPSLDREVSEVVNNLPNGVATFPMGDGRTLTIRRDPNNPDTHISTLSDADGNQIWEETHFHRAQEGENILDFYLPLALEAQRREWERQFVGTPAQEPRRAPDSSPTPDEVPVPEPTEATPAPAYALEEFPVNPDTGLSHSFQVSTNPDGTHQIEVKVYDEDGTLIASETITRPEFYQLRQAGRDFVDSIQADYSNDAEEAAAEAGAPEVTPDEGVAADQVTAPEVVESEIVDASTPEGQQELNNALSESDLSDEVVQEILNENLEEEIEGLYEAGTPILGEVPIRGAEIIPAARVVVDGVEYDVSAVLRPRVGSQAEMYDVLIIDPANPKISIQTHPASSLDEVTALHARVLEGLRNGSIRINRDPNFGRDVDAVSPSDRSPEVTSEDFPDAPPMRVRVIGGSDFLKWQARNNIYADGVNQARLGDRVVHFDESWNRKGEGVIIGWKRVRTGAGEYEGYAIVGFQDGSYAEWATRMLFLNGRREGVEQFGNYEPPTEVEESPGLDPNRVERFALTNRYIIERRQRRNGTKYTTVRPEPSVSARATRRAYDSFMQLKARVDAYRDTLGLPTAGSREVVFFDFGAPGRGVGQLGMPTRQRILWLRAFGRGQEAIDAVNEANRRRVEAGLPPITNPLSTSRSGSATRANRPVRESTDRGGTAPVEARPTVETPVSTPTSAPGLVNSRTETDSSGNSFTYESTQGANGKYTITVRRDSDGSTVTLATDISPTVESTARAAFRDLIPTMRGEDYVSSMTNGSATFGASTTPTPEPSVPVSSLNGTSLTSEQGAADLRVALEAALRGNRSIRDLRNYGRTNGAAITFEEGVDVDGNKTITAKYAHSEAGKFFTVTIKRDRNNPNNLIASYAQINQGRRYVYDDTTLDSVNGNMDTFLRKIAEKLDNNARGNGSPREYTPAMPLNSVSADGSNLLSTLKDVFENEELRGKFAVTGDENMSAVKNVESGAQVSIVKNPDTGMFNVVTDDGNVVTSRDLTLPEAVYVATQQISAVNAGMEAYQLASPFDNTSMAAPMTDVLSAGLGNVPGFNPANIVKNGNNYQVSISSRDLKKSYGVKIELERSDVNGIKYKVTVTPSSGRETSFSVDSLSDLPNVLAPKMAEILQSNGELSAEELAQIQQASQALQNIPSATPRKSIGQRIFEVAQQFVISPRNRSYDGLFEGMQEAPNLQTQSSTPTINPNTNEPYTQFDFVEMGWSEEEAAQLARAANNRPSAASILAVLNDSTLSETTRKSRARNLIKQVWGNGSTINGNRITAVKVDSLSYTRNSLSATIEVDVLRPDGVTRTATRVFKIQSDGSVYIYNSTFFLRDDGNPGGFAGIHNDFMRNWGIAQSPDSYIKVHAAGTAGGFVWGHTGFNLHSAGDVFDRLLSMRRSAVSGNYGASAADVEAIDRLIDKARQSLGLPPNASEQSITTALQQLSRNNGEYPEGFPVLMELGMVGYSFDKDIRGEKWFGQSWAKAVGFNPGYRYGKAKYAANVALRARKDAKKSRDMIKAGLNKFKVSDAIRDYFQNPQTYSGDEAYLSEFANEIVDLTKLSGREESVSKLSMQARVALSKHISKALESKSYETGGDDANSIEKNKQIADGLASILNALNQDQFNRYNDRELSALHSDLKGIDSSILDGMPPLDTTNFEHNGKKMSGSVVATDADGKPIAWKIVDNDSKQVFFIKKHSDADSALNEQKANAVARMLGISGIPFVDTMDNQLYTIATEPVTALNLKEAGYKRLSALDLDGKSLSYDNLFGIMAMDSLLGINRNSNQVLVGKNQTMEGLPSGVDDWTAVPVGNHALGDVFGNGAPSPADFFSLPSLNNFGVEVAQDLFEKLGPVAFKAMMDKKMAQILANIQAGMGGGYFSQAELDAISLRASQLAGLSPEQWAEILG